MSFMGDALAHSVLPGISLFWGALGAAVLVVIGIGLISRRGQLGEDAAIGLSPELVRYIILTMLALTTVVAIQTVGVGSGSGSSGDPWRGGVAGLPAPRSNHNPVADNGGNGSYYADVASGPAIVLTLTLMFVLSALYSLVRKVRQ